MKQNKQSICLAAPPLRQCVFPGVPVVSPVAPLARSERMGRDNGYLPVTGRSGLTATPFLYRSTVDPFCRERPGIVGSRNW